MQVPPGELRKAQPHMRTTVPERINRQPPAPYSSVDAVLTPVSIQSSSSLGRERQRSNTGDRLIVFEKHRDKGVAVVALRCTSATQAASGD